MFEKKPELILFNSLDEICSELKKIRFNSLIAGFFIILGYFLLVFCFFKVLTSSLPDIPKIILLGIFAGFSLLSMIVTHIFIALASDNEKFYLRTRATELMQREGISYYWGNNIPALNKFPVKKGKVLKK